jgi:hypothetical protein
MFDYKLYGKVQGLLDSICDEEPKKEEKEEEAEEVMDAATMGAAHAMQAIDMQAAAVVQGWAKTPADDMDEGEGCAERLFSALAGIVDLDDSEEPTEDDESVFQTALLSAWDYMASKGVPEDDLEAIFNGEDAEACNAAAMRAQEFIGEALPGDDDGLAADMDGFAFGGEQESVFDAVYKKKFAIRKGKKVRINKRIAGFVRRSAKQKLAQRKASRKSHSGAAMARRMRSLRVSKAMGLTGR